jgi:hypothetical protein
MNRRLTIAASGCLLSLCLSAAVLTLGCGKSKPIDLPIDIVTTEPEYKGPPLFEDVTGASGIKFTYRNGEEKNHLAILESLGGGVGLIDFDRDGLYDIFLPAGGGFDKGVELPKPGNPTREIAKDVKIFGHPCKLYKNRGNFQFEDVTDKVLRFKGEWPWSHGAAVCDYDNDGWPDLLVTGWDRLILFHNEPDPDDKTKRLLVDVTEKAGLGNARGWSSSAAWADLDGDGHADIYVCYYTDWSFAKHPPCNYDGRTPDVCPPKNFNGLTHRVFRNNGNGTFTDVSDDCGLARGGPSSSKGLAVLIADLNFDGKPDIYVANDTVDKFMYINVSTPGKIKLLERAFKLGTARDDVGHENGSMGIDVADYNGKGLPSLIVTNYEGEQFALYRNDWKRGTDPIEQLFFSHCSKSAGISALGLVYVGWGVGFVDLDNHGWEDLLFINGHVIRFPSNQGVTKKQRPLLMRNQRDGTFKQITAEGGKFFEGKYQGRGVALGDLNNDGKIDFVVSIVNDNVAVVRNVADKGNHWLGVELKGKNNRDVVGGRLSLEVDGRTMWRFCKSGGSYASTRDPRHVFGMEKQTKPGVLTVYWADGTTQKFEGLEADRYYRITQGDDKAVAMKYP